MVFVVNLSTHLLHYQVSTAGCLSLQLKNCCF